MCLTPLFSVPAEPPPVLQVPANVSVVPGAGAVLSCLVLSAGQYNLTWQRHGRDARLQDPLRLRVLANLSLEVRPAQPSDAGSYSCTAANEGGSAAAAVFLTVQGNRGYRACSSLGRAAVGTGWSQPWTGPTLEVSKAGWSSERPGMVEPVPAHGRGWNEKGFNIPSNPNHRVSWKNHPISWKISQN